MPKTILLTGATDGIGFETAKCLAAEGHILLLHGRSAEKLNSTKNEISKIPNARNIETYRADLSRLTEVAALADAIATQHPVLDILINNAGVYKASNPRTEDGDDIRFIVNTIAPYLLTQKLIAQMPVDGRVVNLSSAAQSAVNLKALAGTDELSDGDAYAQSKLAITMWSMHLAGILGDRGPSIVAVNPASFLGSKMVKEAYGSDGKDLGIGADVLCRAALSDEFANASGRYYDNDLGKFAPPHRDALDPVKNKTLVAAIEDIIAARLA